MFDSGEIPNFLFEGLIYLIPKGEGISENICKWRPTMLLNISYKIFAKMLSFRLQKVLPKVVHVSQIGFMKDRKILWIIFLHFGGPLCTCCEKETKPCSIVVGF